MKLTNYLFGLLFLAGAISLNSCGKYEDGPGLSLKTKKGRISRTWVPEKYIDADGTEVAAGSNDGTATFTKDGVYTYTIGSSSTSGTWAFSDDKESLKITFTFSGVSITSEATILRLTSKELWIKDSDGDKVYYTAQ